MKRWKGILWTVSGMTLTALMANAAGPAVDGKKLYETKCASCHGKDGKGNPGMAKMFKVDPSAMNLTSAGTAGKKDEDLAKIIAEGKGRMPAYSKQLKADEQKAVLKYIRSLAPKKTEETATPKSQPEVAKEAPAAKETPAAQVAPSDPGAPKETPKETPAAAK